MKMAELKPKTTVLRSLMCLALLVLTLVVTVAADDISVSLLGGDVKIAIVNGSCVTISLNGDGRRHVSRIGELLPLTGNPRWRSKGGRFKAVWENEMSLSIVAKRLKNGVRRLRTSWLAPANVLELQECIKIADGNLYGGSEREYQEWPLRTFPETPYVPGNDVGNVMHPYFLSSSSISYHTPSNLPLFVSLSNLSDNSGSSLCFTVKYVRPYRNTDGRPLVLDIDTSWNVPANMTALWLADSYTHFGRPALPPSPIVIRDPIWSTWANYHVYLNQTKVLEFVRNIKHIGFPVSHIEIDDNWETCYGDEIFDPASFPDPVGMIKQIKALGYDSSLWVHPFVNVGCQLFEEGEAGGYFVTVNGSTKTGITKWWRGDQAGIIDVTKPSAADWWRQRLVNLTQTYENLVAFKFDAGEAWFLPDDAYLYVEEALQPNWYTTKYSEFAKYFGGQVEVRVGYFSQRQGGVFTRLLDRSSTWGLDNGLQSVITSTLHFGIVGYPFVLPDYIGGNAYGNWPDRELFIRWTQLNAFLPVMQFSITPWSYDQEVVNISLNMIRLHQSLMDVFTSAVDQTLRDGSPIIRPVWWSDPGDQTAQVVNDEFLVGSKYLVAPIVVQGAFSRDIYLPSGTWLDQLRVGSVIDGPCWLRNYSVSLTEIAYFENRSA